MSDYQLELAPAAQRSVTGPGTENVNRVGNWMISHKRFSVVKIGT